MTVFYKVIGYRDINQRYKYILGNIVLDWSIHENTTWLYVISSSDAMVILEILRHKIAMNSKWRLVYFDHLPNAFHNWRQVWTWFGMLRIMLETWVKWRDYHSLIRERRYYRPLDKWHWAMHDCHDPFLDRGWCTRQTVYVNLTQLAQA